MTTPEPPSEADRAVEVSQPRRPTRQRTEEEIRRVLEMLTHFIWYRQQRPGDHFWTIPVDENRDFDCILYDVLAELLASRLALAKLTEERDARLQGRVRCEYGTGTPTHCVAHGSHRIETEPTPSTIYLCCDHVAP